MKKRKPIQTIRKTGFYTNSLLQLFQTRLIRAAFHHLLTITLNFPEWQNNTVKFSPEIHRVFFNRKEKSKRSRGLIKLNHSNYLQGLFHGKENALQGLHLLRQHRVSDVTDINQTTVIQWFLKNLIPPKNIKLQNNKHSVDIYILIKVKSYIEKTCNLSMIEEAFLNCKIKRDCTLAQRSISSPAFLNLCWYFFTIDSIATLPSSANLRLKLKRKNNYLAFIFSGPDCR